MTSLKRIHVRESTRKLHSIAGFACLAAGLLSILAGSATGGLLVTVGVLNLVMAARFEKTPIILVTRDHLEIQLAPLRPKQFVAFDEIHRVERMADKLVLHLRQKQVTIPAKAMDDDAFSALSRLLKARGT